MSPFSLGSWVLYKTAVTSKSSNVACQLRGQAWANLQTGSPAHTIPNGKLCTILPYGLKNIKSQGVTGGTQTSSSHLTCVAQPRTSFQKPFTWNPVALQGIILKTHKSPETCRETNGLTLQGYAESTDNNANSATGLAAIEGILGAPRMWAQETGPAPPQTGALQTASPTSVPWLRSQESAGPWRFGVSAPRAQDSGG